MVVAGDVDDVDASRSAAGRDRVRGRHDIVGAPADDDDADTVDDHRSGDGVAIGNVVGSAAEEVADGATADAVAVGGRQIGDGAESDGDTRRDDRIAALRARRQQLPGGGPQREVPARRVADDGDVIDAEAMVGADRGE